MKRTFITIFLIFSTLFSGDFGDRVAFPVKKVEGDLLYINRYDFKVGESGYVIRWFDSEHAAIVASVVVKENKGDDTVLTFKPYEGLKNDAFPVAKLSPRVGDEVLIRSNYKRALLIAPNLELYQKITASYSDTNWIHPDLFASELIKSGTNRPTKKDFRNFCTTYAVGIVYFVNGTRGEARDCHSFALLHTDYITGLAPKNERMKPFFSRIGNIEAGWLSFLNSDTGDFYQYYHSLLSHPDEPKEGGLLDWFLEF